MQSPRTTRPYVGLGLKHGSGQAPNMAALEWAKGRLTQLRGQGYRRIVLERDPPGQPVPYFDRLAEDARGMGFTVVREPEEGIRKHREIYDKIKFAERSKAEAPGEAPEWDAAIRSLEDEKDMEQGSRSESMGRLTLSEAGSVLVSGGSHVMHVGDFIAPQEGAEFVQEYHAPFDSEQGRRVRGMWENYQKARGAKRGLRRTTG